MTQWKNEEHHSASFYLFRWSKILSGFGIIRINSKLDIQLQNQLPAEHEAWITCGQTALLFFFFFCLFILSPSPSLALTRAAQIQFFTSFEEKSTIYRNLS